MSSSNKTERLGLNLWIGKDKPKRDDFNADNLKIEAMDASVILQSAVPDSQTVNEALGKINNANIALNTSLAQVTNSVNNVSTQLAGKANLASPAFTGTPTVPTAAQTVKNTQAASTAYVTTKVTTVPASITPNFASGFSSWSGCLIWKAENGLVTITVSCQKSSGIAHGEVMFTLPTGYRPGNDVEFMAFVGPFVGDGMMGLVGIGTNGKATIYAPPSLTRITFAGAYYV